MVRFSFSHGNTEEEVRRAAAALKEMSQITTIPDLAERETKAANANAKWPSGKSCLLTKVINKSIIALEKQKKEGDFL